MKLPSILHPQHALCGLLTLATLLPLTVPAAVIDNGAVTTDPATNLDWADIDLAWGVPYSVLTTRLAPGGDLHAAGWSLATQEEVRVFWADAGVTNAGVFSSAQYVPVNDLINKLKGSMTFAVSQSDPTSWYSGNPLHALTVDGFNSGATAYSFAPSMNVDPVGQQGYSNTGHYEPQEAGPNPGWGYWLMRTHVEPPMRSVLYTKGDAVPAFAGKTFTGFGVPAINESGQVAFLGKFSGGSAIFIGSTPVALIGGTTFQGLAVKSMKDPVLDNAGGADSAVAFMATLSGAGITPANDAAVLTTSVFLGGGGPQIVAQEGTPIAGGPAGALWKSFSSVASSGGGSVLVLGSLAPGVGGITAANATVLWSSNGGGKIALQGGTTQIGGKTVKNFAVLKSVAGTPGQTHAFNGASEVVAKVTFTDGFQAVVHLAL